MLDFAKINEALTDQLRADADLNADQVRVERAAYINKDYARCPWVGVYRTDVLYTPRSMGRHGGSWQAELTTKVIAQAADMDTAEAAEDKLEDLVRKVIRAIWAKPTVGGTVETITEFKVEYSYRETDSKTLWVQEAMITVSMQTKAGIRR